MDVGVNDRWVLYDGMSNRVATTQVPRDHCEWRSYGDPCNRLEMGFHHVEAGPLVRSSYDASDAVA